MRTRQIEVLHAILQAGSITGAARLLEVSQPTITSMLCSVEASTGLALFRREGNRLVATPEIKALAPALDEASASLEALRRMARNLRPDVARQPLRVFCVPSLALTVVPLAVAALRRDMPGLVVALGSAQQEQIERRLHEREIDLGIGFGPMPHAQVDAASLGDLHLVAAGMPAQLGKYARGATIALEALASMAVIGLSGQGPASRLFSAHSQRLGWPPSVVCAQSGDVALRLAERGQGVALVDSAQALACSEQLKVLRIEPLERFALCALHPRGEDPCDRARAFMAALSACIPAAITQ